MSSTRDLAHRVRWLEHAGKRILYNDFSGLRGEDYVIALDHSIAAMSELPDGAVVPSITNITDAVMTTKTAAKGREIAALLLRKRVSGPSVVVGVSGMAATVIGLMQSTVHFAKTFEEAKEWIAKQG